MLTVFFHHLRKSENGNATIELYDGFSTSDNLLAIVNIANNSRPQSVSTTGPNLFIRFSVTARTDLFTTIKIVSAFGMYNLLFDPKKKVFGSLISSNIDFATQVNGTI